MPRGDGRLTHDLLPGEKGPQDACGVFGVWAPGEEVAKLTYFGLYALQHRGQESAGIAVSDGRQILVYKDMGLVSQVFDESHLDVAARAPGHRALPLLHDRVERLGERAADVPRDRDRLDRAGPQRQPDQHRASWPQLVERAAGPRGRARRCTARRRVRSTSDTDLVTALLAATPTCPSRRRRSRSCRPLRGAFSLVWMDETTLYAARDPQGIRPLVLGRLERGWVVASETAALDIVGASFVREVEPGELIAIDEHGLRTQRFAAAEPKGCLFEYVYLARPDTTIAGRSVARDPGRDGPPARPEAPVEADLVIPVPESGTPAAIGYAEASGIPFGQGLVKNAYVGRTFIQPVADHPPARHPAQAQPAARRDPRQAAGRRRRLDRPRQHPARAGPHAARGRRRRGARADLLARR